MNLSAVRHTGSYPDLYLRDRKTLVFTIHMAAGDTKSCMLVCFPRTDAEKRKYVPMECRVRDGRLEHFTAEVTFEDTARYQKYFFRITDREDKVYFLNAWDICETEPLNSCMPTGQTCWKYHSGAKDRFIIRYFRSVSATVTDKMTQRAACRGRQSRPGRTIWEAI